MKMKEESVVLHFVEIDLKELHFISSKHDKEFELDLYQESKSHEFLNKLFMFETTVLRSQICNQNPQSNFSILIL